MGLRELKEILLHNRNNINLSFREKHFLSYDLLY